MSIGDGSVDSVTSANRGWSHQLFLLLTFIAVGLVTYSVRLFLLAGFFLFLFQSTFKIDIHH